jgi:hypothetical protein
MARTKGSKNLNKSAKQVIIGEGINGSTSQSGMDAGLTKIGSLAKTANYGVTQTPSFFYSPELNIMGS